MVSTTPFSAAQGSAGPADLVAEVEALGERLRLVRDRIGEVIFGQREVVEQALITLLSGGHALLIGVPGLAKTRLVETLGTILGLDDKRIQCTPDLMPADILGSEVLEESESGRRSFRFTIDDPGSLTVHGSPPPPACPAARLRITRPTAGTERSFEEFCRKHGDQINTALIDPATAKWLVSEYGVTQGSNGRPVSRAQKHALVVRTCRCGRKIAGNIFFKHVKHCAVVKEQPMGKAG